MRISLSFRNDATTFFPPNSHHHPFLPTPTPTPTPIPTPHRFPPKRRLPTTTVFCLASSADPPSKALRLILDSPGIHQGPACFDALSAKLVERAGFDFCFTSGFSVSAARLGLPDVGLISYGEMVDQGSLITQAVSIPVIGDGDNGYGNHMNVKRTVKGYIRAGFAGIILEDQISPKACGHTQGRKVVSREESVMRIKAAIDAREESGSDIVIVARSDSRQAISLEESLWRSRAFADAGADVLFIDALASKEEMKALCEITPLLPKMANMLEGGGKTPILSPNELEELGFKIVSYPLSLIGSSIRAMEMWVWNHFTFMRPILPSVLETEMSFPRRLYWSQADCAFEAITGHRYVGRLFFEMLISAQVIWRLYAEDEHEDVLEIARDRIVFDRDIWIHFWNHCHFQQISKALVLRLIRSD